MTNPHRRPSAFAAALAGLALAAAASPVLAQSSAAERDLVYLGRSATNVVMASGLPATPPAGQVQVWVWHFFGPDHERSTAAGSFGRAVRLTIDCSDRTSIHRASEQYFGATFDNRTNLSDVATWSTPGENTLGALPVKAVCDPAPATPRPIYADVAAARANADLRLKPSPTN